MNNTQIKTKLEKDGWKLTELSESVKAEKEGKTVIGKTWYKVYNLINE